jgi:hypothetical protein
MTTTEDPQSSGQKPEDPGLSEREKRARKAQELIRKYLPENVRLADELIADRRREARIDRK